MISFVVLNNFRPRNIGPNSVDSRTDREISARVNFVGESDYVTTRQRCGNFNVSRGYCEHLSIGPKNNMNIFFVFGRRGRERARRERGWER